MFAPKVVEAVVKKLAPEVKIEVNAPDVLYKSIRFAVCDAFGTIATVVEAVDVEVTEKTAYGDDEPTDVRPSFVTANKVDDASEP